MYIHEAQIYIDIYGNIIGHIMHVHSIYIFIYMKTYNWTYNACIYISTDIYLYI